MPPRRAPPAAQEPDDDDAAGRVVLGRHLVVVERAIAAVAKSHIVMLGGTLAGNADLETLTKELEENVLHAPVAHGDAQAPRRTARINRAQLEPQEEQQIAGGATAGVERPLCACEFIETRQFGSSFDEAGDEPVTKPSKLTLKKFGVLPSACYSAPPAAPPGFLHA